MASVKSSIEKFRFLAALPGSFLAGKARYALRRRLAGKSSRAIIRQMAGFEEHHLTFEELPAFKLNRPAIQKMLGLGGVDGSGDAGGMVLGNAVLEQARAVRAHRFNLLGSGPVEVSYMTEAEGLLGRSYQMAPGREREKEIREKIACLLGLEVSELHYRPIDWQLDFKAGYRWDERKEFWQLKTSPSPGVDIKVPWELSRFQHGPLLGLANLVNGKDQGWGREFVLQVTDWVAANPYPCGVNWSCTMDVAIRAVNWLWGWVLLKDHHDLNVEFKKLIAKSLYCHGRHIEENLEYIGRGYHGNHYLSNIVGLIYLGALMPCYAESDRWLAFGMQELLAEMQHQVYADGVCFEGSTAYHRLVAELFYSATALVLNLSAERRRALKGYKRGGQEFKLDQDEIFPGWYYSRLEKMAQLILDITKSSGQVPQFGDNDSGRLHKFTPLLDAKGEEDFNDQRHILALAGKLFGRDDFKAAGKAYQLDAELLLEQVPFLPLGGGGKERHFSSGPAEPVADGSSGAAVGADKLEKGLAAELTFAFRAGEGASASAGAIEPAIPRVCCYPHGGVAIYKDQFYYFAIACIPCGLSGVGAHNHNDLLSFELTLLGEDFIVDGGAYLYSPDPALRNAFRSTRAHNTVVVRGMEQRLISESFLFALPEKARPKIVEVGKDRFIASHSGYGFKHSREVSFAKEKITVRDYLEQNCQAEQILNLAPGVQIEGCGVERVYLKKGAVQLELSGTGVKNITVEEGFYSPSYGIRVASKRLVIPFRE